MLAPRVAPPANAAAPCPDLTTPDVVDMGDLLQLNVDTANLYYACQARHQALIEFYAGLLTEGK